VRRGIRKGIGIKGTRKTSSRQGEKESPKKIKQMGGSEMEARATFNASVFVFVFWSASGSRLFFFPLSHPLFFLLPISPSLSFALSRSLSLPALDF